MRGYRTVNCTIGAHRTFGVECTERIVCRPKPSQDVRFVTLASMVMHCIFSAVLQSQAWRGLALGVHNTTSPLSVVYCTKSANTTEYEICKGAVNRKCTK